MRTSMNTVENIEDLPPPYMSSSNMRNNQTDITPSAPSAQFVNMPPLLLAYLPNGMDPYDVEAIKTYRDSIYRKRAILLIAFGCFFILMGFLPIFIAINSSSGKFPYGLIALPVVLSSFATFFMFLGWSRYKNMLATPYIAGTQIFPDESHCSGWRTN